MIRLGRLDKMGIWISRLMSIFGDREARILVLGLDNAGKTTILCEPPTSQAIIYMQQKFPSCLAVPLTVFVIAADRLQVGEVVSTIPSKPHQSHVAPVLHDGKH